MYAELVAGSWLRFLHIPKTAGTSFFADAMFMIPSNMSFLDNGEARLNLTSTDRQVLECATQIASWSRFLPG